MFGPRVLRVPRHEWAPVCGSRCRQWAVASGPRAASLAPILTRRESCHCFRDDHATIYNKLHSNTPILSYFFINAIKHSHPLYIFLLTSDRYFLMESLRALYCPAIRLRSEATTRRAVWSCLGIHFRVGRKVKWSRLWRNWNSDVSGVSVTPFTSIWKISIWNCWHHIISLSIPLYALVPDDYRCKINFMVHWKYLYAYFWYNREEDAVKTIGICYWVLQMCHWLF